MKKILHISARILLALLVLQQAPLVMAGDLADEAQAMVTAEHDCASQQGGESQGEQSDCADSGCGSCLGCAFGMTQPRLVNAYSRSVPVIDSFSVPALSPPPVFLYRPPILS